MESLALLQWVLDALVGTGLLCLAWWTLASPRLLRAVVLFVAFGLVMALAWVRLEAPDIALAEVAIGAGLTGALMLATLARLTTMHTRHRLVHEAGAPRRGRGILRWLSAVLVFLVALGLACSVLWLPLKSDGLGTEVGTNLELSGVSNPVTAVLLNFRAYDTLLEVHVLLLALLGAWAAGGMRAPRAAAPGLVLDTLTRLLIPVLIMMAAYLLWAGAGAPGGAFQAGAVLGAAGVLLVLAGWRPHPDFMRLPLRLILVAGPGLFLVIALITLLNGGLLLEFPKERAGALIFVLEAAATISIGAALGSLFFGARPDDGEDQ